MHNINAKINVMPYLNKYHNLIDILIIKGWPISLDNLDIEGFKIAIKKYVELFKPILDENFYNYDEEKQNVILDYYKSGQDLVRPHYKVFNNLSNLQKEIVLGNIIDNNNNYFDHYNIELTKDILEKISKNNYDIAESFFIKLTEEEQYNYLMVLDTTKNLNKDSIKEYIKVLNKSNPLYNKVLDKYKDILSK